MPGVTWLYAAAAMLEVVANGRLIQAQDVFIDGDVAWRVHQHGGLVHAGPEAQPKTAVGPYAELLADHRVTPDHAGIAAYLEAVRDSRLRQADAWMPEELVEQLGAATYRDRERASQRLAELTPLPLQALNAAALSEDPEIRERAAAIIATAYTESGNPPTPFPLLMEAVCRTVQLKSIKGLAPLLLDTIPAVQKPSVVRAVCDAMAATATTNDLPRLTRAVQADSDATRCAAIYGLTCIHTAQATDALFHALHDKQEHVRLLAARTLVNRTERKALPALAEALESEQAAIRHDAVDTLRAVTQLSFDYDPDRPALERRSAAAAWQTWVDNHGRRATLTFPIDLDLYRYERFRKSIAALSSVRNGTVRTRLQRDGKDIVGGASGFDPGHGVVVVAYHQGQQVLRESFPTHVRQAAHCERFVRALEDLPVGAGVAIVANGEAAQGFTAAAMRGLYTVGGQARIDGFHAHGTYICIGYRGMLPGRATELVDPSGGPLIFRGEPKGILFGREENDDL